MVGSILEVAYFDEIVTQTHQIFIAQLGNLKKIKLLQFLGMIAKFSHKYLNPDFNQDDFIRNLIMMYNSDF